MSLEKVPAHVIALGAKIAESLSFDSDGIGTLPETFFADTLPEGVTVDSIKLGQEAVLDFGDALVLGLGDRSTLHMVSAEGKDLERTSVSVAVGHDNLKASFDRKVDVRAPGSTETKAKYGASALKLESGVGQRRGNLKKIQEHLVAGATSPFSS